MADSEKPPVSTPAPPSVSKPKKTGKAKPKPPTRAELISEALDYRRQGASHTEIAEAMTGQTAQTVATLIIEGLSQVIVENGKDALILRIARYDQMIQGHYVAATSGDAQASDAVMKLEREKAALEKQLETEATGTGFYSAAPAVRNFAGHEDWSIDPMDFVAVEFQPPLESKTEFFKSGPRKGKPKPIPRPNGRPPHIPTRASVEQVMRMSKYGLGKMAIARCLLIGEETFNKYYGDLHEAALPLFAEELTKMAHIKAKTSERMNQWLLERVNPERFYIPDARGRGGPDMHKEGGTGAAQIEDNTKRMEIVGGLPANPNEWAEPPGQAEALALHDAANPDKDGFDMDLPSNVTIIPPSKAVG